MELHFFAPNESVAILERRLPHWSQAGVVTFITFRLADSMPKSVVENWQADRQRWLRKHGVNPLNPSWKSDLESLDDRLKLEFYTTYSKRWHDELDNCYGSCVLKESNNFTIVADSFLKFDGDRYLMSDFVIMPNHAHLLLAFPDDDSMLTQCESWKRFTGRQINQRSGNRAVLAAGRL